MGLPQENAIYLQMQERVPFLLNACELFPRNNMHCRSGHRNCTKRFYTPWPWDAKTQLKRLCDAIVNTAE